MSNYSVCDDNLKKSQESGFTWGYCSKAYCETISSYAHSFCNCTGQFSAYPYIVNGVCMNGPGSLIPIAAEAYYCCCGSYSSVSQLAVSKESTKAAKDFAINDMVLVAKDSSLKSWEQKPVLFSSGTGAKGKNKRIKIYFGSQTEYFVT